MSWHDKFYLELAHLGCLIQEYESHCYYALIRELEKTTPPKRAAKIYLMERFGKPSLLEA